VGERVEEGSKVTLTVSKGNVVRVPDVANLTEDEARKRLRDAGFEVQVELGRAVPADQAGRVIDQNPNANTQRTKGSRVTITITVEEEVEDPDPPTPTPTTGSPSTPPPDEDDDGGGGSGNGGGSGGGSGQGMPPAGFPPFRFPGE
jgi:serine/threonine-protein kinase